MSLPLHFKLIALDSYPHPASNHSIFQKKNVQSQFLILYSKESVHNRQQTILLLVTRLHSSTIFFLPSCKGLRTDALYDSGRTKVAKEEQCIWLFNQSNRSVDLNQLISAKSGNSSSSFCYERNIFNARESWKATKQPNSQRNGSEEK